jgi:hypothetical protein
MSLVGLISVAIDTSMRCVHGMPLVRSCLLAPPDPGALPADANADASKCVERGAKTDRPVWTDRPS